MNPLSPSRRVQTSSLCINPNHDLDNSLSTPINPSHRPTSITSRGYPISIPTSGRHSVLRTRISKHGRSRMRGKGMRRQTAFSGRRSIANRQSRLEVRKCFPRVFPGMRDSSTMMDTCEKPPALWAMEGPIQI